MNAPIAIVGLGCRFPDADSPSELWRSVLAGRRAFRRLPAGRLNAEDYVSADRSASDRTYAAQAAVLDGWTFDRVRRKIAGSTFRSTDLAQWLALDVAAEALQDAGWPEGEGLPRDRTAVLIGNTLTGEFSRARVLRLRWPYVRRTVAAALADEGWPAEEAQRLLANVEPRFKEPFAPIDDDALAGSLSNTIAGRICNTFDLGGGGYTVDAACAGSLLAVANACSALASRDVDVVLAGGVDLSLDPFELVGFARLGALAVDAMRVYDARPTGFVPGEGCGIVALERLADARARGARIYAVIRGWGVSSDGAGGITRPEAHGQALALRRAYARARCAIGSVDLFEGHGTGTAIGDAAELEALTGARRDDGFTSPAAIGSVKANIGHAKAAAGAAGLIKGALSLHERVLPPTTGCDEPHAILAGPRPALRRVEVGEPWPHGRPGRVGVSSAGFGGINVHVVLEGRTRRRRLTAPQRALVRSAQDGELFLLAGDDAAELRGEVRRLTAKAPELSLAELGDLAAALAPGPRPGPARAAIVASTPVELLRGLERLYGALAAGDPASAAEQRLTIAPGVFLGFGAAAPRVGLLFPGQGSPTVLDGGALGRRFEWFERIARRPSDCHGRPPGDTAIAQPAIVACSLGGLELLRRLGVRGGVAVGHSLGELTALHWAGALSAADVTQLASVRGSAMAELGDGDGAMASVAAGTEAARRLLVDGVVLAGLNGPAQTVVSGPRTLVEEVMRRAARAGIDAARLPVSHAFHSPLVADAAGRLAAALQTLPVGRIRRPVCSTITGERLRDGADVRRLLVAQVTEPVRFEDALRAAEARADLLVEVGPGSVVAGLARGISELPVLALDAGGPKLRPALGVIGALFAAGATTTTAPLFSGRFTRPFALDRQRRFLANPCELAPLDDGGAALPGESGGAASGPGPRAAGGPPAASSTDDEDVLEVVRRHAAARVELPEDAVGDDARLLADLHLTSIAVGELAAEVAHAIGAPPPEPPTEMATATIAELARAIDAARAGGSTAAPAVPDGVAAWVRAFAVRLEPCEPPVRRHAPACRWTVHAAADHPLRDAIAAAFCGGDGDAAVLVCLPPDLEHSHADLLLRAAPGASRYAFLQHGGGAGGFARSLALERPDAHVSVIDLPVDAALLGEARAEAEAAAGFREVRLDAAGARSAPVLRPFEPLLGGPRLADGDVVLVSGGGKGIAAECALALAAASGASALLLGRSRPHADPDLASNLARFTDAGVRHRYVSVDVTDAPAVRAAVAAAAAELGPVSAILHGAGVNVPARLEDLDITEIERTLAPKLGGARALLGAVDPHGLRLFVTFGSIIGRIGLRGEAHYALANDRLARFVERLGDELPDCRCLNVEWSVWTGAGMADRLGTVAALAQLGVSPIPVDEGVRWLSELVRCDELPPSVVVSGRFGLPPTAELAPEPLPLRRFLERPRIHYPGVELVVEAELTRGSDPYLDDHVLDGTALLPAVIGLEAMASVARELSGPGTATAIHDARFERPVTVPRDGARIVRLAGLRRRDGSIDVVLRTDETGFQSEHFRATFRFGDSPRPRTVPAPGAARIDLDPAEHVYGALLFHGPRLRRLLGYRELSARSCVAEIDVRDERWFGDLLPQQLELGDPGAHDAAIHAVQACIPHGRLVPIGVERISGRAPSSAPIFARATERSQHGETFVYDVSLHDGDGNVLELWEGLELRRVGPIAPPERWSPALLSTYLERRLEELVGDGLARVAMLHGEGNRRADADLALSRALGGGDVLRRADGRPVTRNGTAVSAAHLNGCTLAVAGAGRVACDIELAARRAQAVWRDLLGDERLELARRLAAEGREELDLAATRVWSAAECIKKAGLPVAEPLKLAGAATDGWALLHCAGVSVATLATRVGGIDGEVVLAVLAGRDGQ